VTRFFDFYILGALGCFFCLVAAHAAFMRRKDVEMTGINRQQSAGEKVEDLLGGVLPLVRFYETVAYALPLPFHIGPPLMGKILVAGIPFKVAGAVMWATALIIYGSAHWVFGTSWRLRVGSEAPGKLVTRGFFSCSRNPIYVSFVLMTLGTFFLLGQFIFLLIALISIPLLHKRILREERFLAATHGSAYQEYCLQVPRYWKWRS
jgi:protein-S-isoprenylcysteine O-methyltransferase Ste14